MKEFILNDGHKIPAVGFGVFQVEPNGPTYEAVSQALKFGYRHIDTAAGYMNEADVGKAVRDSGIPREEIYITSKLWIQDESYEEAIKAIESSLEKLDLGYIDLYLLHYPYRDVVGAWRALEEARDAGKIKSIGVSNMTVKFWNEFVPQFKTMPAVNQVLFNPYTQQKALRKILDENNVLLEAFSPLGHGNPELFDEAIIKELADKYSKSPAQIMLRFINQEGIVVLPKSVTPERIKANLEIFDFKLSAEDMDKMRSLDQARRENGPEDEENRKFLSSFTIHD